MKRFAHFFLPLLIFVAATSCEGPAPADKTTDSVTVKNDSSSGSTAGFKLGVQLWTFREFSFSDALDKVDSAGIKNIEAFVGQKLGGGLPGKFDYSMTPDTRKKVKELLNKKGIRIVAMGVISPTTTAEWIKAFDLAKELGLSYITAEPVKSLWGTVDSLAGVYAIPVAIHDHPIPNAYSSPDSVLAAIAGHPHLGACADIGHWSRNGLNPVDCLKKLQGHVIGVHLKDIVEFNNPKAADTVVSKGVIDFPAVLTELKRQRFDGMLSIEHESNWFRNLPEVIFTRNYYDSLVKTLN